ncbi:hypothetical protein KGF56_000906 [Candida oxycetoniae]|uniref:Thioredoxin domain-containing protein n=1 Tax=Candida oxycetoniae TaxID=497107 RepID=A0AAI9T0Z5_9ASCO|nr:uncharacterized protein KGF56_000906 [Candida oxycetoniae]KAI3406425.2 hypothetical protein KGF56_000906 [Candida oxycetoniae]
MHQLLRSYQPSVVKLFTSSIRTYASIGSRIPATKVFENSPGNDINLAEETSSGSSIIVGVPGAFSPGCSKSHIPGYINNLTSFKNKGIQQVFVIAVNDPFVTNAWREALLKSATGSEIIRFIADPTGAFTKDLDLLFDATKIFGNERSKRYALIVKDGKITQTFVEPDNTSVDVSDASKVLEQEFSSAEIEKAKRWLANFSPDKVPKHHFQISYSRSSGPGGQKVNKTSSKATVSLEPGKWLDSSVCYWIPAPIKAQLESKGIRRDENTFECFKRLVEEIKATVYFAEEPNEDAQAKWAKLEEEFKERKKFNKKKMSDKKRSRVNKFDL